MATISAVMTKIDYICICMYIDSSQIPYIIQNGRMYGGRCPNIKGILTSITNQPTNTYEFLQNEKFER